MMFDSWINMDEGVATMEQERVCTFCDKDAVMLLRFGALNLHMCDTCARTGEAQ